MKKLPRTLWLLDFLAVLGLAADFVLILFFTPVEQSMGAVQKVFYFHLASTWTGMLGFLVAALSSLLFLRTRRSRWDHAAVSGIEIGMVFLTLGIITGSIWARPIWNTWWTWDPRLTTTFIMVLIYAAYFILRSSLNVRSQRARISAVYAITGFISVPLTFLSIRLFRTIHPVLIDASSGTSGMFAMSGRMVFALLFSLVVFTLFFAALFWHRLNLEGLQEQIEEEEMMDRNEEAE